MSTNNEVDRDCRSTCARLWLGGAPMLVIKGERSERKLSRQRITCGQPLNELAGRRPTK